MFVDLGRCTKEYAAEALALRGWATQSGLKKLFGVEQPVSVTLPLDSVKGGGLLFREKTVDLGPDTFTLCRGAGVRWKLSPLLVHNLFEACNIEHVHWKVRKPEGGFTEYMAAWCPPFVLWLLEEEQAVPDRPFHTFAGAAKSTRLQTVLDAYEQRAGRKPLTVGGV